MQQHNKTMQKNTNQLFNLINKEPDIYKIYLYADDPHDVKYKFLINDQYKIKAF